MKNTLFGILASVLLAASAQAANQGSTCDDATALIPDVLAKAKEHVSAAFLKKAVFTTNPENIKFDSSARGGEIWTVFATSPTGHMKISVHVTTDDGACAVD